MNYYDRYIQSLLGFGILKIIFVSLTILSLVGCENDEVVSEKVVSVVEINSSTNVFPIRDKNLYIDENKTTTFDKNETKKVVLVDHNKREIKKDNQQIKKISPKKEDNSVKLKISDPLYNFQWYLHGSYGINISSIWSDYSGKGVSISVVDSGIESTHPDLRDNIDLVRSFRYEDNSSDPSPSLHELKDPFVDVPHGTSVAGIIGASQNDIGISGIAYESNLVGLNVFSKPDDSSFENAIGYRNIDISSNSWGADLSFGLDDDKIVLDAITEKMQSDDPTIYIFAAGNEESNSEFSSILNSRYTLVIGSLTQDGKIASYSNYGANILCVAPGGEDVEDKKIVTTDLVGDIYGYDLDGDHFDILENRNYEYSNSFYGTSAAVPMVSGVVALMLEANRNLSYRDIKYILAHSCRKVDRDHSSWSENGAKLLFSNHYGFGLIDASKAIVMAKDFKALDSEIVVTKELLDLNLSIPDNNATGIELNFDVDEDIILEYVALEVNINHEYSGDLRILLNSPYNLSTLAYGGTITDDQYMPWIFGTIGFMDERSRGKWSIKIMDMEKGDSGVLNSLKLNLYGHER